MKDAYSFDRDVASLQKSYQVMFDTGRPETSNAVWYVEAVNHAFTYGSDWTTHLSLRYPQNTNFGKQYYPS